ncbi:hypothetical protein HUN03_00173 [Mycoplasmopsis anatis]|uniref:Uncharacterized protein n=1 Tax=Mycoplasmopsis anatis TaxID=171279 RepID=A0A9Q3LA55_9BACT|nr:hypothetical protein [Mycoplasmopsis anatis]MBW0594585.1 hypothetical protein [Mycoplasmopsis anatis]MBW0595361.1 hypothetical protein [Mycoplasmopsis anatis]MBW0598090.1 hypothetical protein [Mycoplasmopsis anatis]MBW0598997.1 hypothetical protein [Mycoplasmopsis anatis]MBW0599823.1 hypothetical protein [Mycoplasmopsis anatis]
MQTSILILLIAILFILLIISGIVSIIIFRYVNGRSNSGLILFKIDSINKRVLRFTETEKLLPTPLDYKKGKFEIYNYLPLSDFLEFFDSQTISLIKDVLDNNLKRRVFITAKLNLNSKVKKTFLESLITKIDKKTKRNENIIYNLNIVPLDDGSYYCSISWFLNEISKSKTFYKNEKNEFVKYVKGPFLCISILKKPYYFINEVSKNEKLKLMKKLKLQVHFVSVHETKELLMFIIKMPKKQKYETLIKSINNLNQSTLFRKIIDVISIQEFKKIIDNYEFEVLINKARYCLYNLKNNNSTEQYSVYQVLSDYKEGFDLFSTQYNNLLEANNNLKYKIKKSSVLTYAKLEKTEYDIVTFEYPEINKNWIEFFLKIPYIRYKFENLQIENFIKSKEFSQHNTNKQNKKWILPISEQNFLNISAEIIPKNVILMIYSFDNNFDYTKILFKLDEFKNREIDCAIYINKLTSQLMNLMNNKLVNLMIIGKNITSKINQQKIFFDCMNIYEVSKSINSKLIYEIDSLMFDNYHIEKLGINYIYSETPLNTQKK